MERFEYAVHLQAADVLGDLEDEAVDHGVIILQKAVAINDDDTADRLSARILEQEHLAYPEAICRVLSGEFAIQDRRYLPVSPKAGSEDV